MVAIPTGSPPKKSRVIGTITTMPSTTNPTRLDLHCELVPTALATTVQPNDKLVIKDVSFTSTVITEFSTRSRKRRNNDSSGPESSKTMTDTTSSSLTESESGRASRQCSSSISVHAYIWCSIECDNGKVCLRTSQRERILNGQWLSETEVTAAMFLLKQKFASLQGLVDIIYASRIQDEWIKKGFVQVLNIGTHWVCASNVLGDDRVIRIYDSGWKYSKHALPRRIKALATSCNGNLRYKYCIYYV